MRGERECLICGRHYVYCPNCGNGDATETWRNLYCSKSCRQIFDALSKWKNKTMSAIDAKKVLDENHAETMKLNEMLQADVDAIKGATAIVETPAISEKKKKQK